MSEPTEKDRRKAREWWQANAHRYTSQGVSNNRSGRSGVDVGRDGFAAGRVQGRTDEKTTAMKCWTCGGDPHSHPSNALCICEDGTHSSEVVNLRMLAQMSEREDIQLSIETDAILTLVKWLREGVERAIKCKRPHLAASLTDIADALLRENPHVKEAS